MNKDDYEELIDIKKSLERIIKNEKSKQETTMGYKYNEKEKTKIGFKINK